MALHLHAVRTDLVLMARVCICMSLPACVYGECVRVHLITSCLFLNNYMSAISVSAYTLAFEANMLE